MRVAFIATAFICLNSWKNFGSSRPSWREKWGLEKWTYTCFSDFKNSPLLRCHHTMYSANINKNNSKLHVTTFLNFVNSNPTTLITLDLLYWTKFSPSSTVVKRVLFNSTRTWFEIFRYFNNPFLFPQPYHSLLVSFPLSATMNISFNQNPFLHDRAFFLRFPNPSSSTAARGLRTGDSCCSPDTLELGILVTDSSTVYAICVYY